MNTKESLGVALGLITKHGLALELSASHPEDYARLETARAVNEEAPDVLATLRDARQAVVLLGNYIGNAWLGGGGIPAFDRCELIERINALLDDEPDNASPSNPA
jgi:hypothetical protein